MRLARQQSGGDSTVGLEVLVQLVMAAISTAPSRELEALPSSADRAGGGGRDSSARSSAMRAWWRS